MESAFISTAPTMSDILPSLQPTPPPEMHHQTHHLLAQYQNGRDFFTSTPHSTLQTHHSAFVSNIKRELLHDSNESTTILTTTPPMTGIGGGGGGGGGTGCTTVTPPLGMLNQNIKTELTSEFHSPQSSNNASSSTDNDIDLSHAQLSNNPINNGQTSLNQLSQQQQITSEFAWIGKEKKSGRNKNSGKFYITSHYL